MLSCTYFSRDRGAVKGGRDSKAPTMEGGPISTEGNFAISTEGNVFAIASFPCYAKLILYCVLTLLGMQQKIKFVQLCMRLLHCHKGRYS